MRVDIANLTVAYRNGEHALLALDRVDLQLEPGRVTALVGESGSGKTTLGKALMGLLPGNARIQGRILLGNDSITSLNQMDQMDQTRMNELRWSTVAMVFQDGAATLNPLHRLLDQVAEPLIQRRGLKRADARSRAGEQLLQMGLAPDCIARYPHELSGGQVQRGLLAMALILDPPVLILDEPTASLDAMTKNFVAETITRLREQGKTILLITHDMDLARHLADDIAVLYLGQVMETLPGKDLLDNPCHPYTLALVRSFPSMDTVRDLGGIRGDAFYRLLHAHDRNDGGHHTHTHVAAPGGPPTGDHAPARGCLFELRCSQAVEACGLSDIPITTRNSHRLRCLRGGIAELLALENVEKQYGAIRALQPTDLTLFCGEVFCLVGETGSGKTTLAMIAAGVLKPDNGRRLFGGTDMNPGPGFEASNIGVIYQNPAQAVSHRFSVFDIVAEPLRIRQKQRKDLTKEDIRRRVLGMLSDVRLSTAPEFLGRYPHELNMGAVQRLCLARALVNQPKLLIADEPTSALDPSVQAKVLKLLLDLQIEKGLTLLFVTHDIGLARKIGDRIGVMQDGQLVESGPAAQVLNRTAHPYTRMLIHSAGGPGRISNQNELSYFN